MRKILLLLTILNSSLFISAQSFNGFALYNGQGSNTTYLIDENENIAHTWNMNTECNYTVQLKENGNLVRGTKYNGNILSGAAEAGRVQEIAPDGTVIDAFYHHVYGVLGDPSIPVRLLEPGNINVDISDGENLTASYININLRAYLKCLS